jgi:predicted metal-binding protein
MELITAFATGMELIKRIDNTTEEMIKNGANVIHLATGMVVGYPPCPRVDQFRKFITEKYGIKVVVGTHPIPEKYYKTHHKLGTWNSPEWQELIAPTLPDQETRLKYD